MGGRSGTKTTVDSYLLKKKDELIPFELNTFLELDPSAWLVQ